MSPAAKTNREPVIQDMSAASALRDESAALFLRGMERIAEVQKQFVDTAVQHNKEVLEMVKKGAAKVPGAPKMPMLEIAQGALNRYADIQKTAVDFLIEQNRIWTDAFNDRTGAVKTSGDSATRAMKQAMESSFAVQKRALEHTATQTKAVVDAARNQFGFSGAQADAMTDTFRRGVDTIVEAQKELLNMAIH